MLNYTVARQNLNYTKLTRNQEPDVIGKQIHACAWRTTLWEKWKKN